MGGNCLSHSRNHNRSEEHQLTFLVNIRGITCKVPVRVEATVDELIAKLGDCTVPEYNDITYVPENVKHCFGLRGKIKGERHGSYAVGWIPHSGPICALVTNVDDLLELSVWMYDDSLPDEWIPVYQDHVRKGRVTHLGSPRDGCINPREKCSCPCSYHLEDSTYEKYDVQRKSKSSNFPAKCSLYMGRDHVCLYQGDTRLHSFIWTEIEAKIKIKKDRIKLKDGSTVYSIKPDDWSATYVYERLSLHISRKRAAQSTASAPTQIEVHGRRRNFTSKLPLSRRTDPGPLQPRPDASLSPTDIPRPNTYHGEANGQLQGSVASPSNLTPSLSRTQSESADHHDHLSGLRDTEVPEKQEDDSKGSFVAEQGLAAEEVGMKPAQLNSGDGAGAESSSPTESMSRSEGDSDAVRREADTKHPCEKCRTSRSGSLQSTSAEAETQTRAIEDCLDAEVSSAEPKTALRDGLTDETSKKLNAQLEKEAHPECQLYSDKSSGGGRQREDSAGTFSAQKGGGSRSDEPVRSSQEGYADSSQAMQDPESGKEGASQEEKHVPHGEAYQPVTPKERPTFPACDDDPKTREPLLGAVGGSDETPRGAYNLLRDTGYSSDHSFNSKYPLRYSGGTEERNIDVTEQDSPQNVRACISRHEREDRRVLNVRPLSETPTGTDYVGLEPVSMAVGNLQLTPTGTPSPSLVERSNPRLDDQRPGASIDPRGVSMTREDQVPQSAEGNQPISMDDDSEWSTLSPPMSDFSEEALSRLEQPSSLSVRSWRPSNQYKLPSTHTVTEQNSTVSSNPPEAVPVDPSGALTLNPPEATSTDPVPSFLPIDLQAGSVGQFEMVAAYRDAVHIHDEA